MRFVTLCCYSCGFRGWVWVQWLRVWGGYRRIQPLIFGGAKSFISGQGRGPTGMEFWGQPAPFPPARGSGGGSLSGVRGRAPAAKRFSCIVGTRWPLLELVGVQVRRAMAPFAPLLNPPMDRRTSLGVGGYGGTFC